MSLISNPDYLIHSLRLQYLRNIDDPYGARLITLSPSYASNPYIRAAGLADADRWPELNQSPSPTASDDEGNLGASTSSLNVHLARPGPSGYPGANLKHTQTIMGGRPGSVGMRVSGRRHSNARPRSIRNMAELQIPSQEGGQGQSASTASTSATTTNTGTSAATTVPTLAHKPSNMTMTSTTTTVTDGAGAAQAQDEKSQAINDTAPKIFIPKFKMAADTEARRQQRMAARAQYRGGPGPGAVGQEPPPQQQQVRQNLDPEDSSSEDEIKPAAPRRIIETPESSEEEEQDQEDEESSDDDYEHVPDAEDEDEFDPLFAREGVWDAGSMMSSETNLAQQYPNNTPPESGARLSPVNEGIQVEEDVLDANFEIVTVEPSKPSNISPLQRRGIDASASQSQASAPATSSASAAAKNFERRPVPPMKPQKSALTAMLAATSKSSSSNPFTELYGAISGRGSSASKAVRVYFPEAKEPEGAPMDLTVRADATMEEVLGFALWTYWEEQWAPPLGDPKVKPEDDPRLSAVGWILKIAEEDGEVDEDFPPPNRAGKISKFSFSAYAVLPANDAQVTGNRDIESKIVRRPSRIMATSKKSEAASTANLAPPSIATLPGMTPSDLSASPMNAFIGSVNQSSSYGPQRLLRINTEKAIESPNASTVVPVFSGMYMQEVLEMVCKKRKIENPGDYVLVMEKILVPLDRTVASLQEKMDIMLVKKSRLNEVGITLDKPITRTTDPNASIFKRNSDVPELFGGIVDPTSSYKKYNVVRKLPMLGRHERVIAIDGQYVHLMPSTTKVRTVFENTRTMSYHIRAVAAVQQPAKNSATFKIIVNRNGGAKRYEFEADSARSATEIVSTIKGLKADLERKGSGNKMRRSRQL